MGQTRMSMYTTIGSTGGMNYRFSFGSNHWALRIDDEGRIRSYHLHNHPHLPSFTLGFVKIFKIWGLDLFFLRSGLGDSKASF